MEPRSAHARIRKLPVWQGDISIAPLAGGMTNENYLVEDRTAKYVVRLGEDIPEHLVLRFNELAASRAAHSAGISPAVLYAEQGLTVIEYIDSKTLCATDIRQTETLQKIIPVLRACHRDVVKHLEGPVLMYWTSHVVQNYARQLLMWESPYTGQVSELVAIAKELEQAAGPFDVVFCHNDLIAANFLDDGQKIWLIDWDYAGYNSPLFDLGGLADSSDMDTAQECWMLEAYFGTPPDDRLLRQYHAMKAAFLLRETMWSMISEKTSKLDIDYGEYTAEKHTRFEDVYKSFKQS